MILPYLEEQALYDSFVFERSDGRQQTLTTDNLSATSLGSSGKPANANLVARSTELEVMLCPSDDGRGRLYNGPSGIWARGNYGYQFGLAFPPSNRSLDANIPSVWSKTFVDPSTQEIISCGRGLGGADIGMTMAQITDGTSKSIAIAELRTGRSNNDRRGVWAMGMIGSNLLGQHGSNYAFGPNTCQEGVDDLRDNLAIIAEAGEDYLKSECMLPYPSNSWNHSVQTSVRSKHPGGVFAAMCDGSVQFISDFVDVGNELGGLSCKPENFGIWQRYQCPDDGEVINDQN